MSHKLFFILSFALCLITMIHSKKLRIINGEFALPGQILHQVSLQGIILIEKCTVHICGGSIIDEWHILTAAHCVTDVNTRQFNNIAITVVAGTVDLLDQTYAVYRDVEYIFMPHSYTLNKKNKFEDDIAVLKLRNPLPLESNSYMGAIKLPTSDQYLPPDYRNAIMSGFGVYQEMKKNGTWTMSYMSRYLRYASGVINFPEPKGCSDSQVCVKSLKVGLLEGVCYGDSGGPLFDEVSNTLIGIVSHGVYERCGKVARFTRVSAYLDFINKVLVNQTDSTIMSTEQSHNNAIEFPKRVTCNVI